MIPDYMIGVKFLYILLLFFLYIIMAAAADEKGRCDDDLKS